MKTIEVLSVLLAILLVPGALAQELPQGHPPIDGGGAEELPPGHPAIGEGPTEAPAGSGSSGMAGSGSSRPAGSGSSMGAATPLQGDLLDLGDVKFTVPSAWVAEQPMSSMRKAQFKLPRADGDDADGDLAIYYFGPSAGTIEMNVDRWYGQFSQPDGRASSEVATREKIDADGVPVTLVDLTGTMQTSPMSGGDGKPHDNYRMLAAIAEAPSGPWFIKATGPAETMALQVKAFNKFVRSVRTR